MDILKRLEEYRRQEEELVWEGTFLDYLKLVEQNPKITRLSHARIYDMIKSAGVREENGVKKYNFFADELFGLDKTLEMLVEEYFHSAAKRLDVRRRILLLMGPVSGGKSTIVALLKKGLEAYSRTEEGALYAIKDCPMHEEPLHLIPPALRPELEKELGVYIEGNLCPSCQLMVQERYKGRIEDVLVQRIFISEEKRVGIGTFSPSDPKSQDIADLTGSIDFATIGEYGSESDPRAYRFDGELNKANRGLIEFQEMLKCDEKFLYSLLSLSQEGNFKAGRFALISADEVVIAHTNESEYRAFVANPKNEALRSRIMVIPVPYNLQVSAEVKIYEKLIKQSEIQAHLAPHSLWVAAVFSVLSRLKESNKKGIDLVTKMKLYDGQYVEGFSPRDVVELQQEAGNEGMSGVDPRFVLNRISSVLISKEKKCIHPLDILRGLKEGIENHPSFNKNEKENLINLLVLAKREYDQVVKKEVQKAFISSYEKTAQNLFERYLDNVEAYCHGKRFCDPVTQEELGPDENFMRSIEEQIGVSENAKKNFREEILIRLSSLARQGKKFTYNSHAKLKEAVEKKLFAELKNTIRLNFLGRNSSSPDQGVEEVVNRLVDGYGYCRLCALETLKYASGLLIK